MSLGNLQRNSKAKARPKIGNVHAGAIRFRHIKDVWPNPLQGEPRNKPTPRTIIHPKDANHDGNRQKRRHGISRKSGLLKESCRANAKPISKTRKKQLRQVVTLSRRGKRGRRDNKRHNSRIRT